MDKEQSLANAVINGNTNSTKNRRRNCLRLWLIGSIALIADIHRAQEQVEAADGRGEGIW